MTIIEAMRSGKPFRRKAWTYAGWMILDSERTVTGCKPYGGGELKWAHNRERATLFYHDDFAKDDWEIKDEPIKAEFECGWSTHTVEGMVIPINTVDDPVQDKVKPFIGKRTKVRIEEIREEE